MNPRVFSGLLLVAVCVCCSWGFPVHRHIHQAAIEALPSPLYVWFSEESDWLVAHAVDADKRKHTVVKEAPRHYIDLDAPALSCLDSLGHAPTYREACDACTEDSLWAFGVLPWNVQWAYGRLVEAFDQKDKADILRAAADLGHYVADAHVPLHTTLNYNGQLTGQDGIHAVWETRLPELFGDGYWLVVDAPDAWVDVRPWIWQRVRDSHGHVSRVLEEERVVTQEGPMEQHVREERGRAMLLQRTPAWCEAYHSALGGMVEDRWRKAIEGVAALWWSAWLEAGQPDLTEAFRGDAATKGMRSWWKKRAAKEERNP